MAFPNPAGSRPADGAATAPATVQPVRYIMPHEMEVERSGGLTSGLTNIFPEVRGGVCSFCGVIDQNYPSHYQYKLCQHYRGQQLACSYCPSTKDMDDVINHARLRIIQHPDNPRKLIVCCDSYGCRQAHEKRWKVAQS